MSVDPELLEILVCPKCRGTLDLVELPEALRARLVERYREHFRDEVPVVEQGLRCRESALVYPIVSDIPLMLVEEALPASVLDS
ncbi:MAG: Trm112 family protein [Thermoanaerobaculia bacterium]